MSKSGRWHWCEEEDDENEVFIDSDDAEDTDQD